MLYALARYVLKLHGYDYAAYIFSKRRRLGAEFVELLFQVGYGIVYLL